MRERYKRWTVEQRKFIRKWYKRRTDAKIGEQLGCTAEEVARQRLIMGLKKKRHGNTKPPYMPPKNRIEAECRKIQATWSEEERDRRARGDITREEQRQLPGPIPEFSLSARVGRIGASFVESTLA